MSLFDGSKDEGCPKIIPPIASDGGQSPLERIMTGLQNIHRRYLLYYLQGEDPCDFDEAARQIAAWEYECEPVDVSTQVHDQIKFELYHIHIPKLENLDIIDYDDQAGAIRYDDPPESLDDFIDLAREEEGLD